MTLSLSQLEAISAIERACSVLSLLGCVFVIATFCSSSAFHKPINRLVFYATFGNMMTNIGTLMSRAYLGSPHSAGCQLQAFLIQMFMPADAFWTLAMAINVYLTFYRKFDAQRLRKMEPIYLLACYGIPLVPAFVYLFVKNSEGQRVYGNAVLWCWVSAEWDTWRISTFYGPVWVVIVITFFIYIRAGRTIYERRKQLHGFRSSDQDHVSSLREAAGTIRTEVTVTAEAVDDPNAFPLHGIARGPDETDCRAINGVYSVHISSGHNHTEDAGEHCPLPTRGPKKLAKHNSTTTVARSRNVRNVSNPARRKTLELNNAAWSYTKCAILFFTALLITWLPSSANRVYSLVHTKEVCAPLEFMSAFVLPLQGFWNAVIYTVTSWKACKSLVTDLKLGRRPDVTELVGGMRPSTRQGRRGNVLHSATSSSLWMSRPPTRGGSESTTELAKSHSNTANEGANR